MTTDAENAWKQWLEGIVFAGVPPTAAAMAKELAKVVPRGPHGSIPEADPAKQQQPIPEISTIDPAKRQPIPKILTAAPSSKHVDYGHAMPMLNVREYAEGLQVRLAVNGGRWTIYALNECGHNGTEIDLLDVIDWVKTNRPELMIRAATSTRADGHAPRIDQAATQIVGCTCGWRTPAGTTDSDVTYTEHLALALAQGGNSP